MFPDIWCVTDVIVISHFELFFALLPPPNSPKNQYFEKMKKAPGNIIILHMCTKMIRWWSKNDQMIRWCTVPKIWCMTDLIIFHFGPFLPFYPLTTAQKIKILRKLKKCLEISSFYICLPRTMIRWLMVPEICCVTDVIVISHFELFFTLLPP